MKVEMDVIGSVLKIGDLYLDPGSGSFIIQILLAALLGSAFAIKMYWKKLKSFIVKSSPADSEEKDTDLEEDL
ncbi:MAG: hypothetical protein AB9891_11765 [Anaerolineaceae bacterium]